MSYTKTLFIVITCFFNFSLLCQEDFEGLGETEFAINHKVSDDYSTNFSARTRYYFYRDSDYNFESRQIDLVHFSTLNLSYNKKISFGIQYRFRESFDGGSNELRLTQQFNYTKSLYANRYGHRVRLEQRILDGLTILRTRYRFALDFPLNGEKLDVGEGYFISSMEALLSLSQKIKPEIDHRTTAFIGWLASERFRLQFGLEYRFEAFNLSTEQRLFILSSFILKV